MILKFVMRDTSGAVVSGTPTVTADGIALTPTGSSALWQVDADLGTLVSATLAGAVPLDVMMPTQDPTLLSTLGSEDLPTDYAKTGEAAAAINVYQPLRASDYVEARNDLIIDIEERTRAIDGKVNTVDGILDTILPLIRRVYRYFFNKRTHTNSSVVVYADDGVTPDATMAVSGDTTTVTKSAPE